MTDLERQLRTWASALADQVPATSLDELRTAPGGTPRRRLLAVAASVVVVLAGVTAIAVVGRDDGGQPTSTVTASPPVTATTAVPTTGAPTSPVESTNPPSSTTTTLPESTRFPDDRLAGWPAPPTQPVTLDAVPFLLPSTPIPNADSVVRSNSDAASVATPVFTQVFVDAERDVIVTLRTRPGATADTPDELRTEIDVDGWDDAYLTDGRLPLVASDSSGTVQLDGTGVDPTAASELIGALQRRAVGLPGWEVGDPGLVEVSGAWSDTDPRRLLTWFDGDDVVAQMISSPWPTDLIAQALGDDVENVDISGTAGLFHATGSRRAVVWSPDAQTVVVLGVVDPNLDPLAIARSVGVVDQATYDSATTDEFPDSLGDGCSASLFC